MPKQQGVSPFPSGSSKTVVSNHRATTILFPPTHFGHQDPMIYRFPRRQKSGRPYFEIILFSICSLVEHSPTVDTVHTTRGWQMNPIAPRLLSPPSSMSFAKINISEISTVLSQLHQFESFSKVVHITSAMKISKSYSSAHVYSIRPRRFRLHQ